MPASSGQRIFQIVGAATVIFLIGRWSMPTGQSPAERTRAAQDALYPPAAPSPSQQPPAAVAVLSADLTETRRALSDAQKSIAALTQTVSELKASTEERVSTLHSQLKSHVAAEPAKPKSPPPAPKPASPPPRAPAAQPPRPAPPKPVPAVSTPSAPTSAAVGDGQTCPEQPLVGADCPLHPFPETGWFGVHEWTSLPPQSPLPPKDPPPRPYDPASAGGYELEPLPKHRECLPPPVCIAWPSDGQHPRGTPAEPETYPPELCRSRHNVALWRDDGKPYEWFWGEKNGHHLGFVRWETTTLDTFHRFINADTVHLDFGAWIGPTALFAATHALKVFALEPDLKAHAALKRNVQINAALAPKITVSNECISSKREELVMTGAGQSDSIIEFNDLTIKDWVRHAGYQSWTVQCDTLPAFFKKHNLRPGEHRYFLKMDTEAAESMIVPSLYEWLRNWEGMAAETTAARIAAGKQPFGKPTLLISMHGKRLPGQSEHDDRGKGWPWWDGDPKGHAFLRTLLLYRSVSDQSQIARWKRDVNPITIEDIQGCVTPCSTCYWGCDLLATDIEY